MGSHFRLGPTPVSTISATQNGKLRSAMYNQSFGPVCISAFDSLPDATNLGGIDG